ncbi:hypothetical protein NBRC3257_0936 [Gluconobacter thailandicus NBRC 3257]|uniref:Transposase n=1 Tax=Gluconobacter thailandicus NBRC 3257 TaxID=1381097 RepID=A0ABQ0IUQ7_GLUTH|nr:hypothetical protein NBRC3255_0037 [Gluconobacter thailandicus NBRC 3255]GAD25937.1 hypothetical protein NBRC3257_0936 [Gluconobacter thailandicus NBRC 3257]
MYRQSKLQTQDSSAHARVFVSDTAFTPPGTRWSLMRPQ